MKPNIRRGLFRTWVLATVAWVVFVISYSNPLEKLEYAKKYYLDHGNLVQSHKAESLAACNQLRKEKRAEEHRSLHGPFDSAAELAKAAEGRRLEGERNKPLPTDANERLLESGRRFLEAEKWRRDNSTPTIVLMEQAAKSAAIEARYLEAEGECERSALGKPEPPDYGWLALALLPPTIGILILAFGIWVMFVVCRWLWRGFFH